MKSLLNLPRNELIKTKSVMSHNIQQMVAKIIYRSISNPTGLTTTDQDLHIQHAHLHDRLRPSATRKAAATIGLHDRRISAQTLRKRLREAHLCSNCPHCLDLTAVRRRYRIEWANGHTRWLLARWSWINISFQCKGQMADSVWVFL